MTIGVGDKLPAATFKVPTADGVKEMTTDEVFAGKKIVLVGVPGAFTPTCSNNHLPGFIDNYDALLDKGVDGIAVLSVNDQFVMQAWSRFLGVEDRITFLADGNAEFSDAIGLAIDLSVANFGKRCQRFSAIVDDGVVKSLNIEVERGKATNSGAAAMLEQL
ncbi:MAG: peroxiredoxin [Mesorhizobium sp.]|nr:peroxiredoxin [Mesorhizobium sp.]